MTNIIIISVLGGLASLFIFLYIRSAIANGKLRGEIAVLKEEIDVKKKQMEIAAQPKKTPYELFKKIQDGNL